MWNPHRKKDFLLIENVQRGFTKYIKNVAHLDYRECLAALELYSLQRRRERYLIIYVWKILGGHVLNLTDPILSRFSPRRGRYCETSHVNHGHIGSLRFNSFRLKSCRLFNCLPRNLRNISSCSVLTFKRRLDAFLKTIPDDPLATNTSNCLDHLIGTTCGGNLVMA